MSVWYDTALVCLNGHVVNWSSQKWPDRNDRFCSRCGAKTISQCTKCNHPIRGDLHVERVAGGYRSTDDPPPAFCAGCGAPYPWTQTRLEAARQLVMEMDVLPPEERDLLGQNLDDIVTDTPRTAVAATRVKRLLAKARDEGLAFA